MSADMISNSAARSANAAAAIPEATAGRTVGREIVSTERALTNQDIVTEAGSVEASDQSNIAEKVKQAADTLNQFMSQFDKRIAFDVYDDTDQMYVKVIDKETNKVLRTYPPEELLDAAARMHQVLGIIFDKQA